jgi:hypothetical protein
MLRIPVRKLSYLKIAGHGGGCAVVLRYVKRPPTKKFSKIGRPEGPCFFQGVSRNKRREKPRGKGSGKVKDFAGLLSNNVLKWFLTINSSVFWRWIWAK